MAERSTDLRERILRAAADLLASGGREAVSTRAVSAAAGVQAPAIYRQFGDMQGLLLATAREVLAEYVRQKAARKPTDSPLEELRRGWDLHVAFGLANPAVYALLYGDAATETPEARDGYAVLRGLVTRVAAAGLLRMSIPQAERMIHAGGCGVTLSLIAMPPEKRDLRLSTAMREAVFAAILAPQPSKEKRGQGTIASRAVTLRASLAEAGNVLSPGEQQLMGEWLDRLANANER